MIIYYCYSHVKAVFMNSRVVPLFWGVAPREVVVVVDELDV